MGKQTKNSSLIWKIRDTQSIKSIANNPGFFNEVQFIIHDKLLTKIKLLKYVGFNNSKQFKR